LKEVSIYTDSIALQGLLKWAFGISGGIAKQLIQDGQVQVNEQVEVHRSKQVVPGDIVDVTQVGTVRVVKENGG
jgi:ribosome-associated protein